MAVRALIIAIEDYPQITAGGVAKKLEGTLAAGLNFKAWLLQKLKAEGSETGAQVLFCSEPQQPGGMGASSEDIKTAMLALKQEGASATEELYVFFSGHGFSYLQAPGDRADVIISSDFKNADLSSHCCLKLDAIVLWLSQYLGPGRHYYFVDACRNTLTPRQIQVGGLPPLNPQATGEASFFVMQSTGAGATATVGGPFPTALLDGLHGRGKAKIWDGVHVDAMFVRFDSLLRYVKEKCAPSQRVFRWAEGEASDSDAILTKLKPVPTLICTVVIGNGLPVGEAQLVYRRGSSAELKRLPLTGAATGTALMMEPDTYAMTVEFTEGVPSPREPLLVDLFEDRTLTFNQSFEEAAGPVRDFTSAVTAQVEMTVPYGATLGLRNVMTGEVTRPVFGRVNIDLSAGPYMATLSEPTGQVFLHKEIELRPGPIELNLTPWTQSAPHIAIASKLPVRGEAPEFSESLDGSIVDPDLALWLAIVGGGRILSGRIHYSKLASLPLHDFRTELPGASPIYVLAGFEDPALRVKVGVFRNDRLMWIDAHQPDGMPGIHEAYVPATPGPQLVSCAVPGYPPCTLASLARRNYATLVTVTLDDDGVPSAAQFLVPLGHLVQELPEAIRERIAWGNPLANVRYLAVAIRAFSRRRAVAEAVPEDRWKALLSGEWLDPIGTPLAAYECWRRGKTEELRALAEMLVNAFPDLPDTAALAQLSGLASAPSTGVPLFLDGLRALDDYVNLLLPASRLDFRSPWTLWRGAV